MEFNNPYTGPGAIKGLLQHRTHNLWDILATRLVKQTCSYGQATYGTLDAPDFLQQHAG